MSTNVSLSVKQSRLLQAILAGHSILTSAKIAGVSEQTAHRWLKEEPFSSALKQAKDELFDAALDELKADLGDPIAALRKHIAADVEPTAASQMAAIKMWIDTALQAQKIEQLEQELAELKQALQANDAYGQH